MSVTIALLLSAVAFAVTFPSWVTLPGTEVPDGTAHWFLSTHKPPDHVKADTSGGQANRAQTNFQCPHDFGFYPHDVACDKYWACEGSIATLKTCGNGLAFDDTDKEFLLESCDYIHNVDCSTRPERQPAIASPNCPYQYGIFSDEVDCTVFWSCWGGESSRYQCGPGLAYDQKQRICTWIDKVAACNQQRAESQQDFPCPAPGTLVRTSSFTRHAHPDDCRQYYVCLDGIPREYGCPIGTVFQIAKEEGQGQCADPETVPGCENYYGDVDIVALRGLGL